MDKHPQGLLAWLLRNWLELLLLLVLGAALAWIFRTGSALLPEAEPAPTPSPTARPTDSMVAGETPPPATEEPAFFDSLRALGYVGSQVAIGPRPAGTAENATTAEFIVQELASNGWQVEEQPFEDNGVPLRNILGKRQPTGAIISAPGIVILATHFDTSPTADLDPDPNRRDQPVPGANDGGSGVAVLLELARALEPARLRSEVWLVFLDGHYGPPAPGQANEPLARGTATLAQQLEVMPEAVILLDMVGASEQVFFQDANSDPQLSSEIWQTAEALGYRRWFDLGIQHAVDFGISNFNNRGIPAAHIIGLDYPHWRTTEDGPDKIGSDSMERVGRILEVFLEGSN